MRVRFNAFVLIASAALVANAQKPEELRLITDVTAHLSKASGHAIYVESRAAREKVPAISTTAEISAEKLEECLQNLVKSLPRGSGWAKVYLPPPPKGKVWKADEVLEYVRAQARLYGTVGAVEPETVEILSQKLPPDKAKSVISDLNLKPVYVISIGRGTFAGVWQTTYGEMRLQVNGTRVTGTYTTGDGVIDAILQGSVMRGRWHERARNSGGQLEFTLSEDGETFSGRWTNDSSESVSTWTGTRVSRR